MNIHLSAAKVEWLSAKRADYRGFRVKRNPL